MTIKGQIQIFWLSTYLLGIVQLKFLFYSLLPRSSLDFWQVFLNFAYFFWAYFCSSCSAWMSALIGWYRRCRTPDWSRYAARTRGAAWGRCRWSSRANLSLGPAVSDRLARISGTWATGWIRHTTASILNYTANYLFCRNTWKTKLI